MLYIFHVFNNVHLWVAISFSCEKKTYQLEIWLHTGQVENVGMQLLFSQDLQSL